MEAPNAATWSVRELTEEERDCIRMRWSKDHPSSAGYIASVKRLFGKRAHRRRRTPRWAWVVPVDVRHGRNAEGPFVRCQMRELVEATRVTNLQLDWFPEGLATVELLPAGKAQCPYRYIFAGHTVEVYPTVRLLHTPDADLDPEATAEFGRAVVPDGAVRRRSTRGSAHGERRHLRKGSRRRRYRRIVAVVVLFILAGAIAGWALDNQEEILKIISMFK